MTASCKTFLITGVSRGLGAAFADAALAAGHHVVGTVRTCALARAFETKAPGRAQSLIVDLARPITVARAIEEAGAVFDTIDILVNNAGYGHEGPMEESALDELREQMEVNLFAPAAFIKAVVPGMRQRRSGHIINITSMAAGTGFPGLAYYCSSKFALDGLSESLSKELRPFGIFVTAFAPGQFRTDWAGCSMRRSPRQIGDYDPSFEPLRAARFAKSGHQPGNPARAAQILLDLVSHPSPPSRLFVGSDAFALAMQKIRRSQAELGAWEAVSRSTDFGADVSA